MAVAPLDAGSWIENGKRQYPDKDISYADLEDSLLRRGKIDPRTPYNEWGLTDYEIRGVIAAPPYEIWGPSSAVGYAETDLPSVLTAFPGLPVIIPENGQWVLVNVTGALYCS